MAVLDVDVSGLVGALIISIATTAKTVSSQTSIFPPQPPHKPIAIDATIDKEIACRQFIE
ncbi:MAG: hypothetical protein SWY16_19180 [Cyanobacteriota bacterium]|nr:hypothetical protein [Cyanobacteriota bacterium]